MHFKQTYKSRQVKVWIVDVVWCRGGGGCGFCFVLNTEKALLNL